MAETARVVSRRHGRRDMRWLELRGRTYYAVQAVPRPLWGRVGKRRLVKSLGTRDHHVAMARRHAALAEFQRIFDGVRSTDARVEAALEWRQTFSALQQGDTSRFSAGTLDGPITDPNELRTIAGVVLADQAEDIESERSWTTAETQISPGSATASNRAATLTPSPWMSPSSTITSPRLIPIRKTMRWCSGVSA